MRSLRRIVLTASCVTASLTINGCQSTPPPAAAVTDTANDQAAVSPVVERSLRREREFNEAITGLSFDDGTLQVSALGRPDPERAWRLYTDGDALLERNQRTPAIKAYATAVRTAPDRARLYIGLADAFIASGKTEHAAATLDTAVALDELFVDARVKLATTLWMAEQQDEAIQQMQEVVRLDPNHGFGHERLAIWLYYGGDDRSAWMHVEEAERVGHTLPPQFIALLGGRMPRP